MSAEVPGLPGTWWCFYLDAEGRRVVLTMSVARGVVLLATSAGERLLFSRVELAALVDALECAAVELAEQS